ncbi:MAG TPA: hypothetical protein VMY06_14950 [Sedimentisphaerales bacterium]|nr:hypothetical protein [Sedimentisphaerales bacterium]HUU15561.1 hypothetical protein [Sedimentisphaerales bacterium]
MGKTKTDNTSLRGEIVVELKDKDGNPKLRHAEGVVIAPVKYEDCSMVMRQTQ